MITPEEIISELEARNIKHEVHRFASGCSMIDIWIDEDFYVIQIEPGSIGTSKVDDTTGFSLVPDEQFFNKESFKRRLLEIIS